MKLVETIKAFFSASAQPQQPQANAFTYKPLPPTSREGWDPKTQPLRNSVDHRDYPMGG